MSTGHLEVGPDHFPVAVQGDGPPILFVHDVPGDWRSFAPHAALLSEKYRCITYTQRWFGSTEWRQDGPTFDSEVHASDLVAVAEALDFGRLSLVAYSYGAHVALKAAVDRPDLFNSLLCYEPPFGTFIDNPGTRETYVADARQAWAQAFEIRYDPDEETLVRAFVNGNSGPRSFERLAPEIRDTMRDSAPAVRGLLDNTVPVSLSCQRLNMLQIPTTVGWGAESRACFTIPAQIAADCINGDQFEIDGVGHLWPLTNPEAFCRVVDYWMSRLLEESKAT